MNKRKLLIIGAVVIVIGIGGFFWKKNSVQSKNASSVETSSVKRTQFIKTISSSGKTKADRSVSLKFQTSGLLSWVGVKEGDTVKKGQILAQLDARDVQKNLEKALKDYANQRSDFEEAWKTNWSIAAQSHENLDHAPNPAIKRILEKNQWNLEKSVLDVELKHLSLEYSRLFTPIDGIVAHIDTPVAGINITPAGAVFDVIDPSSIVFEAKIDETDVGDLALGQKATVSLDAYSGRTFTGTIKSISYSAETSTGGATVFPVTIQIVSDVPLRVGYNGDVTIETNQMNDVLVIPIAAIREDGSSKFVYKKVGNEYTKQEIESSITNEDVAVVTKGLSQGDEVVTKGFTAATTK